jgi:predicted DNA-binding transcriptional regulator YafY
VDGIVFRVAADAVLTRKRLSFSYKSRSRPDEEERRRIVSPQRLVHYRDNWYLDAWCHGNDALRTFALDQMRDARLTDEKAREIGDEELDRVLKSAYGIFAGSRRRSPCCGSRRNARNGSRKGVASGAEGTVLGRRVL